MTRRATGRHGPNGLAHVLRKEIGLDGQTQGWLQWGVCTAVHGALYTNTTLYADASAGATSIQTHDPCQVNDFLQIGTAIGTTSPALLVGAVSGSSAPYTVKLQVKLPSDVSNGDAVVACWTVDLNLNGSQNMASSLNFRTFGVRFEEGWNPVVGDVVPVMRGPAGLVSDRFVLRELTGARGPGGSAFVSLTPLASGPPPSTTPFGYGSLYVDPAGKKLYVCTVASIQNSSGVVTTPATWLSTALS